MNKDVYLKYIHLLCVKLRYPPVVPKTFSVNELLFNLNFLFEYYKLGTYQTHQINQ
jgi:hypothetical protein